MGAYNTLHASVECSRCGAVAERSIQFKYGEKWLYDYRMGETLRWGGNDEGVAGAARVRVRGVAVDDCSSCGLDEEYYVLTIERDVIMDACATPYDDLPPLGGSVQEAR